MDKPLSDRAFGDEALSSEALSTEDLSTKDSSSREASVSEGSSAQESAGSEVPTRQRSRSSWLISLALLVASLLLWVSSRLVWTSEFRDAGVRGMVLDTHNGAQAAGALVPLAILALAGIAGMLAAGHWLRKVLAGVLVLAGIATGWIALSGISFGADHSGLPIVSMLIARSLALLAGILLLVAGLWGMRGTRRRSQLGSRYNAPGGKQAARDPETELWEALSQGEDPTVAR
jgi:hypothetical protein